MARVSGLWVYQRFGRPDPDAVTAKALSHGLQWLTVEAVEGTQVLGRAWLGEMRRATRERGMRLGVHGYVGRPTPRPLAEANAFATAIDVAQADFAIVNAEIQYETSATPDSRDFTRRYRALKGDFPTYFSSFGRPGFHGRLNWAAWAGRGASGGCRRPTRTSTPSSSRACASPTGRASSTAPRSARRSAASPRAASRGSRSRA